MNDYSAVEASVARAMRAIQAEDRRATVDAIDELTDFEPGMLLTELFATVDDLVDGDPNTPVPATDLLPDAAESGKLLRAVIAQDQSALTAWAPGGFGDLVTGLLALAAALSSEH